jgi:hypothetical protein
MNSTENWGSRENGGWRSMVRGARHWSSEYDDDPYNCLRMRDDESPEWFDKSMSAKQVVSRMVEEQGNELELYFTDVNEKVRVVDRINDAFTGRKCQLDPDFFVEYFATMHWDGMYRMLAETAANKHPEYKSYICINPECLYIYFTEHIEPSIRKCRGCSGYTSVRTSALMDGVAPSGPVMMLVTRNYMDIMRWLNITSRLSKAASDSKHISMHVMDYRPAYRIGKNMPGIKVDGDHFIRGRVNREVLSEVHIREWPGDGPDYPPGHQEDPTYEDLIITPYNVMANGFKRFFELLDEPKKFLDPSKADKFREEYIDSRWDDEFAVFVRSLIDSNILLVDSSGVHETLTTLYHMAQRMAEKRTVIKKTGKIVFPTKKVLEHINPHLMARAFEMSEHAQYTDPTQVFRMDGGTA